MGNKRYDKEFKQSAIQLAINTQGDIRDIAQDLGINKKTLYNWVYEHNKRNRPIDKSNKESINDELIRLRRDNRRLKQERDILKKATAYFAKETL